MSAVQGWRGHGGPRATTEGARKKARGERGGAAQGEKRAHSRHWLLQPPRRRRAPLSLSPSLPFRPLSASALLAAPPRSWQPERPPGSACSSLIHRPLLLPSLPLLPLLRRRPRHRQRVMSQKYGCSLVRFTHAEDFVIHASTKGNGPSRPRSFSFSLSLALFRFHAGQPTRAPLLPLILSRSAPRAAALQRTSATCRSTPTSTSATSPGTSRRTFCPRVWSFSSFLPKCSALHHVRACDALQCAPALSRRQAACLMPPRPASVSPPPASPPSTSPLQTTRSSRRPWTARSGCGTCAPPAAR